MFYRVSHENKAGRSNITNGARSPPELVKLPGLSSGTKTSPNRTKCLSGFTGRQYQTAVIF